MIDGLPARIVIGLFALMALVLAAGSAIIVGEARAARDGTKASRYSAQLCAVLALEITLIVVLSLS